MKEMMISTFMLERYRLGELKPEDKEEIQEAAAKDPSIHKILEELDKSDNELRLRYNADFFKLNSYRALPRHKKSVNTKTRVALLVAAVFLCVFIPLLYFVFINNLLNELKKDSGIVVASAEYLTERAKGQVPSGSEIFIYLKGGGESPLNDQAILHEGHTVQLAYSAPAGAEHYGVIFSIDGRSVVTMHYPYRRGQSSSLVSGRRTLLNEAYMLDDAPGYEVFVFVISNEPLNVDTILNDARKAADDTKTAEMIIERVKEIFIDCEVETITVLKEIL